MAESLIKKIQPDPDGLDFDGLRKEGIRFVQESSGDIWTDYNLHDPGVTILEALCYALTDLVYRTGFNTADYLASSDGGIDYNKQALYRPDAILSCRPVTENDYRKLILNSVPNIDNVWIKRHTAKTGDLHGLYHIYVQLNERVKNRENEGVKKAYISIIEKVFAANRNLCEDLAEVEIVDRMLYSLSGEIEVDGQRGPENILAEIYFECAQYLSPKFTIHSYAEMYKNGSSLEDLFTGVLTEHGYIAEEELHAWRGHFSIADLVGIIGGITGVTNIKRLFFVDGKGQKTDRISMGSEHSCLSVACLRFPLPDDGISLYKAGKVYQVSPRDVETEFNRLDYKYRMLRQRKQKFDWLSVTLPAANFRNIREYYSIQNNFPDVYGLNAYGVPDSATPERKAQARQLKAYLLFFEQVMANFLQSMQEIPSLFSVDEQLKQSYFYQVLQNHEVPNVEEIYLNDIGQIDAELAELLASVDNYGDRRNRVLDYLLGIYGEKFSQNSLHHFFAEGTDTDDGLIRNKIALLKEVVDISKNRAAAFDYHKPSGDNQNGAGLKKKLQLLLGLKSDVNAPEQDSLAEKNQGGENLHIVEHILLRPVGKSHQVELPDDFYSFRISVIFPAGPDRFANMEFRKLAGETVYLNCPAHIHPEIFWLEPARMRMFEMLHAKWLKAKRPRFEKASAATELLIRFLLEIREKRNE